MQYLLSTRSLHWPIICLPNAVTLWGQRSKVRCYTLQTNIIMSSSVKLGNIIYYDGEEVSCDGTVEEVRGEWGRMKYTWTHWQCSRCCEATSHTWDISMQGSLPTLAPVKPYTELALILRANWRPSSTLRRNESVSCFNSALALGGRGWGREGWGREGVRGGGGEGGRGEGESIP